MRHLRTGQPIPGFPGVTAPTLRPLWIERHDMVRTLGEIARLPGSPIAGADVAGLRSSERLDGMAATLRGHIAAGDLTWPLPGVGHPDSLLVSSEYSWRCPGGFMCLPPVQAFLDLERTAQARRKLSAEAIETHVGNMLNLLFVASAWRAFGRRVYYLDPWTADLLLQTPLPAFDVEEIRDPLPSFAIALSPNQFSITVPSDPEPQEVDSIYVTFTEPDTQGARLMTILVAGRSPRGGDDDNVYFYSVPLQPGTPIDAIRFNAHGQDDLGGDMLRLVLGLCLYLASEHPSIVPVPAPPTPVTQAKNVAKLRKQQQRASRASRLGFVWVGGRDPSASASDDLERPVKRWALDHAFWVQGHWRNQPYGAGRSQRRLIWIKPHRKGPDFASAAHARPAVVQPANRLAPSARATPAAKAG